MSEKLTRGFILKSAIGIFVLGTGGLYYAHRTIQNKVRGFSHYKETFKILERHEEAKRSLGTPIQVGKIDISDRKRNYVGDLESKLRIPISGNLNGGYLNVVAHRDSVDEEFCMDSLELELQDEGQNGGVVSYIVYEKRQPLSNIRTLLTQPTQRSIHMWRLLVERLTSTMTWPAFLQPHVESFVAWVNGVLEYWDLEYLEYLLWLFLPIFVAFVLPIFLLFFIYGCVIFLHVYGLRHQIREAYASSYWDGARTSIASFWDGVGYLWHGYEVRGLENIPDTGPGLLVAYHGTLPLDLYYLIAKCILYKKRTIHCVADKFVFKIPGWGKMCKVFCMTPGTVEDCISNLKDGNLLIIAPGGVREALFSSAATYQIMWGKRLGFAKVVIGSNAPVIPMFTENCRDAFRTPRWGRRIFRGLYERTRLPICPIYGGFPVKMITHLGEPMYFERDGSSPEQIKYAVKKEVASLIREHQRLPGSIFNGMLKRIYGTRRRSPAGTATRKDASGAEALLRRSSVDGALLNGRCVGLIKPMEPLVLRPDDTELRSTPLLGTYPPVEDESLMDDDDPNYEKLNKYNEEDEVGTSAI